MKRTILLTTIAVSILFSCVGYAFSPQQQWEYKLEYKMTEKRANDLGAQGWELAAIESTSNAGIGSNVPVYVFKRPKS